MKIQDMILVIQNIKGNETNMLMTLKEYKEAYLFVSSLSREESAQALKELFDTKFSEPGSGWAERYITANKSYYAKFCSGSDELQCFLHGSYNDDKKFQFDREESSRECMWALEEYNLDVGGGVKAGNIGILLERGCHFIIKRNLRKESKEDWLRMAKDNSLDVTHPRDGGQEMLGKKTPPETGSEAPQAQDSHQQPGQYGMPCDGTCPEADHRLREEQCLARCLPACELCI